MDERGTKIPDEQYHYIKKMIIINAFITSGIWMQLRETLL